MTKYLKPAIIFLIYYLFQQCTCAQTQSNIENYITKRFLRFCENVPREEIFVHSDRENYIAGENLWFDVCLIDRQSQKPSVQDKIVYFELLNQENRPILQKRILLKKGFGPGQIDIPDTISSGTYTIRAYTSWMKNFLPDNCFMKEINIYNAFSEKAFKGKSYSSHPSANGSITGLSTGLNGKGQIMTVNNLKTDTLEINIDLDKASLSDQGEIYYLFIQTHGVINKISTEKIMTDHARIILNKNILIPGINHITLFDSNGRPVSERFIYTPEAESPLPLLSVPDKVNTREKIICEIDMGRGLSDCPDASNLSISVTPAANHSGGTDLTDYMVFGTEFGINPLAIFKGRKINELSPVLIDSLLLTLKSNWIAWDMILAGKLPPLKYNHETDDHYLYGKLINRDASAVDSGKFILMSIPGKVAQFQYARLDKEDNFSFRIGIDENIKDIIIQPANGDNNCSIKMESSFSDIYLKSETTVDSTNKTLSSNVSKLSVNYQVSKIYGYSSLGEKSIPDISPFKPARFYGKPDVELIMADYIKLPVMEEVFFELISGAFLKNRKSGYEISVTDPVDNKTYDEPPALLVDGVIIRDASIIANLDPEIIQEIDVEREKYFVGDYLFYGIVNVISKAGDFNCVQLPDYATRISYRIVEPARSFLSPDYSTSDTRNNRIPDFRNTLYWNPSVKPDKEGKTRIVFWSSDLVSDYEINIQGVTSDGNLVSCKKIIKVE